MPLHHHGGAPHTKRQQHTKTHSDTAVTANAAGIDQGIHTEPWNHGLWERAVHIHAAGHAPAPTTGGTLSNTENAGKLEGMANGEHMQAAAAALSQVDVSLGQLADQALTVLSEGTSHDEIQGAIQNVRNAIAEMTGGLGLVQDAFTNSAARMRNV